MIYSKAKRCAFIGDVNKLKANYGKMNQDVLIKLLFLWIPLVEL